METRVRKWLEDNKYFTAKNGYKSYLTFTEILNLYVNEQNMKGVNPDRNEISNMIRKALKES